MLSVADVLLRLDDESRQRQLEKYRRWDLDTEEDYGWSTPYDEFINRDDPGNPLGIGMPLGQTFRLDGESHRDAWMRILRADPCSYCRRPAGSLDHIVPQAKRIRGLHSWSNYTGSCEACNGSKSDESMLIFLARRRGVFVPKLKRDTALALNGQER